MSFIPTKPEFIVEARGDVFTLDLLKLPALSQDKARKIVQGVAAFVAVQSIGTSSDDHLDIRFDPFPEGARNAFRTIRSWF